MRALRIAVPFAVLAALVALVVNVGAKLNGFGQAVGLWGYHPVVFGVVFGVGLAVLLFGSFLVQLVDVAWSRPLAWAGDIAMGALVYAMLACLAADVLRLAGRLAHVLPTPTPRPVVVAAGCAVLALVAGILAYGLVHRGQIVTRTYNLTLASPRADRRPLRAALISDLHLGELNRAPHLTRVVDAVQALQPDVVLIAGDVFDGTFWGAGDPAPLAAQFRRLTPPLGTFAILGNHDAGPSCPQMVAFLEEAGVTVLRDAAVDLDGRLTLVGRRDSSPIRSGPEPRAAMDLSALPRPIVVLDHQPSHLREYAGLADLMLSGHTHKGQLWPGNHIVARLFEVAYGHYQVPGDPLQAVTTSGAATWGPPLRLATDSEVVLLNVAFLPPAALPGNSVPASS